MAPVRLSLATMHRGVFRYDRSLKRGVMGLQQEKNNSRKLASAAALDLAATLLRYNVSHPQTHDDLLRLSSQL